MKDKLATVAAMRGVDYLPTWARSPIEMWTEVPRDLLARELGFVTGMGFNSIRIWLSAWGFEQEPRRYLANLSLILDECHARRLTAVVIPFDSCGVEPGPHVERTLGEALMAWGPDNPSVKLIKTLGADPRVDFFEAPELVVIPDRRHGSGVIWEWWVPSPGYKWLGTEHRKRWRTYATKVIAAIADHPALALIDVMNEPFMSQIGTDFDRELVLDFLQDMTRTIRTAAPELPLTVGAESLADFQTYEEAIGEPLDVVSYHDYGLQAIPYHQPELMRKSMNEVIAYASGRPVLLSEWGSFPGVHEEDQRDHYENDLKVFLDAPIGWTTFHLIAGYGPFALSSLLYPNGTMKLAAKLLRKALLS